MTGAAQGVDASRAVFAFARDNALPGSFWLKQLNSHTRTPVFAVWFVIVCSSICGLLGFSTAALNSLAGYVITVVMIDKRLLTIPRASVIGLYTSYATPIFIRVTFGRDRLVPGPFTLGKWFMPIGTIAVLWVSFIIVLLLFPTYPNPDVEDMSASFLRTFYPMCSYPSRLRCCDHWRSLYILGSLLDI